MRRRLCVTATVILLSGCAATQPTPAQERAYGHIAECSRATSYAVNPYVDANGRIRLGEGRLDGLSPWKQCMRERFGYRFQGD